MSSKKDISDMKNYEITWTDIYGKRRIIHVKLSKPTEDHAIHAIPNRGDIFKKIDKIQEVVWCEDLNKFIPKLDLQTKLKSKVPVYDIWNNDWLEYSSEFIYPYINGEIPDFNTAHQIATDLLKTKPNTSIMYSEIENSWWVGHMNPVKKNAQWRTNYDYPNEGLYTNLDKYKSVSDFRKKRRKKRKKDLENILNSRPDRYKAKA